MEKKIEEKARKINAILKQEGINAKVTFCCYQFSSFIYVKVETLGALEKAIGLAKKFESVENNFNSDHYDCHIDIDY